MWNTIKYYGTYLLVAALIIINIKAVIYFCTDPVVLGAMTWGPGVFFTGLFLIWFVMLVHSYILDSKKAPASQLEETVETELVETTDLQNTETEDRTEG